MPTPKPDTLFTERDQHWMRHAMSLAKKAEEQREVPVGAILVLNDSLVAEGWNQSVQLNDPTAHAEIMALRAAGKGVQNYRLLDAVLYVTLEPCAMCVGAMVHARVKRVVYGAHDPKAGAVSGALKLAEAPHFNHKVTYHGGLLATECGQMLTAFFRDRR